MKIDQYLTDLDRLAVFDGAIGTELNKYPEGETADFVEWLNLEAPEIVGEVHQNYLSAGADIVTTNTFSANSLRINMEDRPGTIVGVNRTGAEIASEAVSNFSGSQLVAGSVGPTGRALVPSGPLTFSQAYRAFTDQIVGLRKGGVDLVVIETMESIREARAAALAARDQDLPFVVSMTYSARGVTNYGTTPPVAAVTFDHLQAGGIGANCTTGPAPYESLARAYHNYTQVPVSIEPNAGQPELRNGEVYYDITASDFLEGIRPALSQVAIAGSCCGSSPSFTELLRSVASNYPGYQPVPPSDGQDSEYVTSKQEAMPPSNDTYALSFPLGKLSGLRDELKDNGIPLLRITEHGREYQKVAPEGPALAA